MDLFKQWLYQNQCPHRTQNVQNLIRLGSMKKQRANIENNLVFYANSWKTILTKQTAKKVDILLRKKNHRISGKSWIAR